VAVGEDVAQLGEERGVGAPTEGRGDQPRRERGDRLVVDPRDAPDGAQRRGAAARIVPVVGALPGQPPCGRRGRGRVEVEVELEGRRRGQRGDYGRRG
jgi:hypothetical protein